MRIEESITRVRNELELFKEVSSTRFSGFAYDVENILAEITRLTAENKGLNEYSESRDESIKVYREEIMELKERLKGIEECSLCPCYNYAECPKRPTIKKASDKEGG